MAERKMESTNGLMEQIQHYWHIILKWKWFAMFFLILCIIGAVVFSLLIPPVYTATGSVWIEGDSNILPFEELQTFGVGINQQSHARLIRSQTLAAEVIEKLELYKNPDFIGKLPKNNGSFDTSDPEDRQRLILSFLKSVSVSPVERTSLLDVKFSNRNPILAADILNTLFDAYIDMLVTKRYTASEQATQFLNTQIESLREEIDELENELSKYGSESNILPLTDAETPTISRLEETNRALMEATIDKINKLNYYNQIKSAPIEEISDILEGSLIQSLRLQYNTLSREYARKLVTLRPEHPEMQRLKSEMDTARESLKDETENLINAANAEYLAALRKENSLKSLLEELKDEVYKTSSQSVMYNSLRIEIENKKNILDTLSRRLSETSLSSRLMGMEALNVWIVDQANPPLRPEYPKKKKNILYGLLLGIVGAIGLALGIEYLDQTVKTSKDVIKTTDLSILGVIPSFETGKKDQGLRSELKRLLSIFRGGGTTMKERQSKRKNDDLIVMKEENPRMEITEQNAFENNIELISMRDPLSIQSESYRSIRTSLLGISFPETIKSILVTSPLAKEGKSSTVSNLGITLANANMRVVIVDSDLRKPSQDRIFNLTSRMSLNQYLDSKNGGLKGLLTPTPIPNLCVIKSDPFSGSPIELLTSERMNNLIMSLKKLFGFILFDTPPLLAVSDALAMGALADGVILVGRSEQTPINAIKDAKKKLDAHNLNCLGIILNDVNLIEQSGYYAREYYHYYTQEKKEK